MVTRSAVMYGGSPRATVKELYSLIKDGTIHLPSPLRLLRLCNGRRCESCNIKKVKHANQGLGTFLCNPCLTKGPESFAVRIPLARARYLKSFRYILKDERLIGSLKCRWRRGSLIPFSMLRKPMVEQGGEPCGSRFTHCDLELIEASNEPVDQLLDELFPPQNNPEFIETYEASLDEAKAVDEYRKEKKVQASKRAAEARRASALKVVSKVQKLLEEPWKDFALANKEIKWGGKSGPCLEFHSPLCNELLKEYVTTPSKAKKAVIANIAETINTFCRNLLERFVGFSFLSEDDTFEKTLKQVLQESLPDLKSVVTHHHANSHFASILERGNDPFEALEHLEDHQSFSRLLTRSNAKFGHGNEFSYNASHAWDVVYSEQKDEPCERKRQSKTFAACMLWKTPLDEIGRAHV